MSAPVYKNLLIRPTDLGGGPLGPGSQVGDVQITAYLTSAVSWGDHHIDAGVPLQDPQPWGAGGVIVKVPCADDPGITAGGMFGITVAIVYDLNTESRKRAVPARTVSVTTAMVDVAGTDPQNPSGIDIVYYGGLGDWIPADDLGGVDPAGLVAAVNAAIGNYNSASAIVGSTAVSAVNTAIAGMSLVLQGDPQLVSEVEPIPGVGLMFMGRDGTPTPIMLDEAGAPVPAFVAALANSGVRLANDPNAGEVESIPGTGHGEYDLLGNPFPWDVDPAGGAGPISSSMIPVLARAMIEDFEPIVGVDFLICDSAGLPISAIKSGGGSSGSSSGWSVASELAPLAYRYNKGQAILDKDGNDRALTSDMSTCYIEGDSHQDNSDGTYKMWSAYLADDWLTSRGVTVVNNAVSSSTTDEVSVRAGGKPLYFTVTGGSIPASGSVALTLSSILYRKSTAAANWAQNGPKASVGTLGGVAGTLWYDTSGAGQWTFTRTNSGSAVPIPSTARWVDLRIPRNGMLDFDGGTNDYLVTGTNSQRIGEAVTAVASVVESRSPLRPAILLTGGINPQNGPVGSDIYNMILGINTEISMCWPHLWWDQRKYITSGAFLADLGLTPTSTDLTAIANDCPPAQIMNDNYHIARAALAGANKPPQQQWAATRFAVYQSKGYYA